MGQAPGAETGEAGVSSAPVGLRPGRLGSSQAGGHFADLTRVRLLFQKQRMFVFVFLKLTFPFHLSRALPLSFLFFGSHYTFVRLGNVDPVQLLFTLSRPLMTASLCPLR